jgi:hypothetical protein
MVEGGKMWTEERTERAKELWLGGFSASQIAADLGRVTRNSVIGKLNRLGLMGRGLPTQPQIRRTQPRVQVFTYKTERPAKPQPRQPPLPKVEKIATLIVSNAVSAPLSKALLIDALTARTCRWMDGHPKQGGTFCGHTTLPGKPWCPHHFGRVYWRPSINMREAA